MYIFCGPFTGQHAAGEASVPRVNANRGSSRPSSAISEIFRVVVLQSGSVRKTVQSGNSYLLRQAPLIKRTHIFAGLALAFVAGTVTVVALSSNSQVSETAEFTAPGLEPMTIDVARMEFWRLTPALLLEVYDAFGQTEESAIYDTLEAVTHGDALEYLYLERVGAMAGGGLEEADQTIHEIKLLNTQVARDGAALAIDASWQVIGTVGHAEHLHVRGNTYSADLTVAPVDGAWRITDFELLDVNRDTAGETFDAPQTN